jgi:hypothetical protein
MTTSTTCIAPNVKPGKKRKRLPQLFRKSLVAGIELIVDDILEGVGGKDYLAALFANGVLGERSSRKGGPKVPETIHRGAGKYSKRKYRITKEGGGEYKVERA